MADIEIRPVSAKCFFSYPGARHLIKEYSKECANRTLAASPPNEDQYVKLEEMGLLKAAGAFDGDTLVGFVAVVFSFVPHFKGEALASTESLFLSKSFRTGANGLKLLKNSSLTRLRKQTQSSSWRAYANNGLLSQGALIDSWDRREC